MLGGSAEDEQSGRHEDSQERRTTGVHSYLHVETTGEQIYNIEKTTLICITDSPVFVYLSFCIVYTFYKVQFLHFVVLRCFVAHRILLFNFYTNHLKVHLVSIRKCNNGEYRKQPKLNKHTTNIHSISYRYFKQLARRANIQGFLCV